MATDEHRGALYRVNAPHQHSRVTYAELFFDLVFVFAVTQISHTLLAHFTPLGVLQITLLFLAVWWVWVYTSWITNWLDPEQDAGPDPAVRADARRARALHLDSAGLRIARDLVRRRLCGDAGRQDRVPVGVDAACTAGGAHECDSHYGLAVDVGAVLDRRRLCRRAVTAAAVGRRARDRIQLGGGAVLDSEIRRVVRSPTGWSRAVTWPSAARCSSSSRSANPSSSPARRLPN